MANNTALKFYRGASAPATPAAGMIWFDTSLNLIQVYNGTKWEKYGKVQDVTFVDNKLTISKSEGDPIVLNFSDVASAKETMQVFAKLESSINDVDTKVNNLNTKVGDIPEGATATTVVGYVDEKVKAAGEAATEELGKEVEALEKALADEATTARAAEKANADAAAAAQSTADGAASEAARAHTRIDALIEGEGINADIIESFKELNDYLADHEDVKEGILDAIEALEDKVGEGKVDDRIATAKEEIIAEIEKNEEVTAEALNDLNTRVEALEGQDEYVKATVDQQIATAEQNAKDYADGLAGNYDAAGSAAAALEDANEYTDEKIAGINTVIGVKEGENAPSGLYKEIADAAAAAQSGAEATAAGALETFVNGDFKDLQDAVDAIAGEGGSLADTLAAANEYTDEKIAEAVGVYAEGETPASGLRKEIAERDAAVLAEAKEYADGLNSAMDERVDALETAVGTTLPNAIATAKSEAVEAAGLAADQKIADLKLDETYEKVGVAETKVNALANGAVKDNADAIAALKSDLEAGAGMFWASFE